ncbi:uncharacterized protein LOC123220292 isoform X2 [Mangifera indica]|uniref:uncharacterized protein LOC123220292 isoform X2 n=2 Tax=Mangifera indica TaxID=29780 RepID=UPI001CFB79CC|nr:uncharacterized protein LOC123220292 isoform X2 [Mangifera indica]
MGEHAPSMHSDDDDATQSNPPAAFQTVPTGSSMSSTASRRRPSSRGARPMVPRTSPIARTSPPQGSSSRGSYRATPNVPASPPRRSTSRASHSREHPVHEPARHSVHGTSYSGVSYDRLQQILMEHERGINSQMQQQLDQHGAMMRAEWERQSASFREDMQSYWQQQASTFRGEMQDQWQQQQSTFRGELQDQWQQQQSTFRGELQELWQQQASMFRGELQDQWQQQQSMFRGEMQEKMQSLNNRITGLEGSYVQASESVQLDESSDEEVQQQIQDQPTTAQKPTTTKKVSAFGRVLRKGKQLVSPFTNPVKEKKNKQPVIKGIDVDPKLAGCYSEFTIWYDQASDNDSRRVFLGGPAGTTARMPKPWWTQIVTLGQWLENTHIEAFMGILRKSYPDGNWTTVSTQFVALLPQCYSEFKQLGANMEWPTFFLDQINGISLRTKEFFRPWSSVDKVFFPINFDNQHWVCGVLDINEWRMYIYDSAQYTESIERVKKLLMPFRTLTHLMKASNFYISKGIPSPDPLPTLQYRCVRDVPKQDVGSGDCGIFLLMFMEYLARDHPFNFTSAHSKRLRKRVATTIFQGRTLSFEDF